MALNPHTSLLSPVTLGPSAARTALFVLGLVAASACQRKAAPEPSPAQQASTGAASIASQRASSAISGSTPRAPADQAGTTSSRPATDAVTPAAGDPVKGNFTLLDATKGLTGDGKLTATIETDLGALTCDLYEDKAPITVANFVGLARGTRPWKKAGTWVTTPLYDGTVFHRVVKGFMIQGGDPNGNGSGGPGYEIPDEIWEGAKHDERGLLCMANRGKNTNGSQFFIMDGKAAHLDGGYTIFGKCGPDALVEKLASVEVSGQSAVNPTKIKTISVTRSKR